MFGTIQEPWWTAATPTPPIPGASIVILGPGGPYTLTANAAGQFSQGGLLAGTYTVNATATGYQGIATAKATINCSTATVLLVLYTPPQQDPTPTPTRTPTPDDDDDPTPTPQPTTPPATATPVLPPNLPSAGHGSPFQPRAARMAGSGRPGHHLRLRRMARGSPQG